MTNTKQTVPMSGRGQQTQEQGNSVQVQAPKNDDERSMRSKLEDQQHAQSAKSVATTAIRPTSALDAAMEPAPFVVGAADCEVAGAALAEVAAAGADAEGAADTAAAAAPPAAALSATVMSGGMTMGAPLPAPRSRPPSAVTSSWFAAIMVRVYLRAISMSWVEEATEGRGTLTGCSAPSTAATSRACR